MEQLSIAFTVAAAIIATVGGVWFLRSWFGHTRPRNNRTGH